MISLRALHSYLSIFVAPTILFFALTGTLQLFDLHESHGGYDSPVVVQKLARLHKDQIFALEEKHDDPAPDTQLKPKDPAAAQTHEDEKQTPLATLLLKWFFLFAALALVTSTCLGLWMGLTHIKRQRLGWLLLALGTILPGTLTIL